MNLKKVFFSLALLATSLPAIASAANVAIIHGIDGRNIGFARELPVDIAINGECALTGVTYTKQAKTTLDFGDYEVTIHPSDGRCSQPPLLSKTVTIPDAGELNDLKVFSIIASLTARGNPQIAVFDDWKVVPTSKYGAVRHLAKAGSVNVDFREVGGALAERSTLRNGQSDYFGNFFSMKKTFRFRARLSSGNRTLANVETSVANNRGVILNVFGSAKNGFVVVRQVISLPQVY